MAGVPRAPGTRAALPFCHFTLRGRRPPPDGYPEELRTLGNHLRAKRLDLGLLQREVARKLGVTEDTVHNWETDRKSPQLRSVPKIIAFLGYDPYDIQAATLGERIVAASRRLGLSQKELARRLHIDQSTVGRNGTGRGHPGGSTGRDSPPSSILIS